MLRLTCICLLLLFAEEAIARQDSIYVRSGDTVRYTYTPVAERADTLPVRRSFVKRVVDYFGQSTVDRTFEKKIDFTFIGGPNYSKDTQLGLAGLAAGLYRLDRTDSITSPSDVSFFFQVSITGFYRVGVSGNNIFRKNRSRLAYDLSFSSQPTDFWGLGYHAATTNAKSSYVEKRVRIETSYLYSFMRNAYAGVQLDFAYTKGIRFTQPQYIEGQRAGYTATGVGIVLHYDSRDFIPNPQRGVFFSFREIWFPRVLGNCNHDLWRTQVTLDWYRTLWKGGILAFDLYGEFNSEATPWPMLARLGGNRRMRGYYEGRYIDRDMVTVQVELRQRIWRRIGGVIWGGAGNVFPALDAFRWNHTLPNYGFGLRWEFKNRVNVRFDIGFGRKTSGFMFNINEAF